METLWFGDWKHLLGPLIDHKHLPSKVNELMKKGCYVGNRDEDNWGQSGLLADCEEIEPEPNKNEPVILVLDSEIQVKLFFLVHPTSNLLLKRQFVCKVG